MQADDIHPAALPSDALLAQCDVTFTRRSGPGGQHRNKTSTAAVLHHRPTGVSAEANERRSQAENRSVAEHRLRVRLALQIRKPRAMDDTVSELWKSRVSGERIAVNPQHEDFPALLAEALDWLAHFDMDLALAAERLGVSGSQLVKFLKFEPAALAQLNNHRREVGLKPLR